MNRATALVNLYAGHPINGQCTRITSTIYNYSIVRILNKYVVVYYTARY